MMSFAYLKFLAEMTGYIVWLLWFLGAIGVGHFELSLTP